MVQKHGQSERLLLNDWMPLLRGQSVQSFGFHIPDTLPTLLCGILAAVLQFHFIYKQDGFIFVWHVQISGRITIELPVHHKDHQDLEGANEPAG